VLAQAMNVTILAFAQRDLEPRLVVLVTQQANRRGLRPSVVDQNRFLPAPQLFFAHHAVHLGHVHLRSFAPRMSQGGGEVTVVREEQHTTGFEIEAPDGNDALLDTS
jgi:hypothetical protein